MCNSNEAEKWDPHIEILKRKKDFSPLFKKNRYKVQQYGSKGNAMQAPRHFKAVNQQPPPPPTV